MARREIDDERVDREHEELDDEALLGGPSKDDVRRGGFSFEVDLPGHGEPVAARRYRCPRCDYVWVRRSIGQRVPHCPTHLRALDPCD